MGIKKLSNKSEKKKKKFRKCKVKLQDFITFMIL